MPGFSRLKRWLRDHPLGTDTLLAVFVWAATTGLELAFRTDKDLPAQRPMSIWLYLAWSAASLGPMILRRRPWIAIPLALVLGNMPQILHGRVPMALGYMYLVLAYAVAAYLPLRSALIASVALWVPGTVIDWFTGWSAQQGLPRLAAFWINTVSAVAFFAIGRMVHNRRARVAALEERARMAEDNQRVVAERAVAEERRRIARELHDVVAHHVSVMGVLATGARRTLRRDPDAAEEALATIEDTGRTALREMRRLLDVLRTKDEKAAELTPQPGLVAVEELVDQVREAGLSVRLHVEGDPYPLDPGMALSVYRVVQESLTNTLKHAGPARAEVRVEFQPSQLTVEVADDGRGPRLGGSETGHGLVGMRERVALYHGQLRAGPRPGGGYRVYAKIPVDSAPMRTGTT